MKDESGTSGISEAEGADELLRDEGWPSRASGIEGIEGIEGTVELLRDEGWPSRASGTEGRNESGETS